MPVMKRLTVDGVNYDTVGEASVTQVQTSGTKIATVTIDGTATDLYAPEGGGGGPEPSSTTPAMDGTAAVGTATTYARADHVHPTDTSRQATLVSGTNIKTINGTSILGSGDLAVGGSVSMTEEEVDAAVEAAWPAPTGYAITPDQGYVDREQLLAIGLSDSVEQGEFVATASEGETVYVMGASDWEPQVTIDSTGTSVAYVSYGPTIGGFLFTFTMPAEAVTVAMWYND